MAEGCAESLSAWVKAAQFAGSVPVTHGGVLGQSWRGRGPRQTRLAKALDGIEVLPLDERLGRLAGQLLAHSGTNDVIDAALVLLAQDGDDIVKSDPEDIEPLAALAGRHVALLGT